MKTLAVSVLATLSLVSGAAVASADLAKAKNCMACHALDKKLLGPSYKDVAAKYASDKGAAAKLAKKIREGGTGVSLWHSVRRRAVRPPPALAFSSG